MLENGKIVYANALADLYQGNLAKEEPVSKENNRYDVNTQDDTVHGKLLAIYYLQFLDYRVDFG